MKIAQHNISDIIKYMRKSHGIKQIELCKILNCTQAQISYVENGKRSVSAASWENFCQYFCLDSKEIIQTGRVRIINEVDNKRFRMPRSYSKYQYSSGEMASLYIDFFCKCLGRESFIRFCKSLRINPLYFVNLENSINIEFLLRLTQELIMKGYLSTDQQIENLASYALERPYFLCRFNTFQEQENPYQRLKTIIQNMHLFEKNHDYILEEDNILKGKLVFSLKPLGHIDQRLWSHDYYVGGFIERWIPSFFKAYANNGQSFDITQTNSFRNSGEKSTYSAQLCQ